MVKSDLSDARKKNQMLPKFERKVGYGQCAPPAHPQISPVKAELPKKQFLSKTRSSKARRCRSGGLRQKDIVKNDPQQIVSGKLENLQFS